MEICSFTFQARSVYHEFRQIYSMYIDKGEEKLDQQNKNYEGP